MKMLIIRFFSFDKRLYFLVLCAATFLITFMNHKLLLNEAVYWNSFGEQLSLAKIQHILAEQRKWIWLIYLFIPVLYLLKFLAASLCLSIGSILWDMGISYRSLFRIVLVAEGIFLIPAITKVYWFSQIQTKYALKEVSSFSPWSLFNYLPWDQSSGPLAIASHSFDAFEILYWFVLAGGIFLVSKHSYQSSLKLVMSSYGVGLLIWVLFLIFIELSVG